MPAFDRFLAHLQTLTQRLPEVEAHVLWHADGVWSDAIGDVLEAEEITFYTEGLLAEGFSAAWQHLASAGVDAHIRLLFWQSGAPELPDAPPGWTLMVQGMHPE
jgi:hypothetical protein